MHNIALQKGIFSTKKGYIVTKGVIHIVILIFNVFVVSRYLFTVCACMEIELEQLQLQ